LNGASAGIGGRAGRAAWWLTDSREVSRSDREYGEIRTNDKPVISAGHHDHIRQTGEDLPEIRDWTPRRTS
jgi:hypothetical protein